VQVLKISQSEADCRYATARVYETEDSQRRGKADEVSANRVSHSPVDSLEKAVRALIVQDRKAGNL
jgi:hypothetical protein